MTAEGRPGTDRLDLVEHGQFVRRLAWRLLRDEDAAEDVVQETLLAATRAKPDPSRPLRPWLATVARNLIRKRFRSAARLRRREEAAARPEGLPSTAELAARAEVLREVAEAVHALDEPNRSAVLLRFYEDLPPREIAARLGVPVETVRGRIKRGVGQIRARLDRRHGRAGWAPPLTALVGFEAPVPAIPAPPVDAVASAGGVASVLLGAATGAVLSAAIVVGVGLGAASSGVAAVEVASAPSLPASEREDPVVLRGRSDTAAARLRRENDALEERVRELEASVAALRPSPTDPAAFRFGIAEDAAVFHGADWLQLAQHVRAIEALMPETIRAYLAGGDPTIATRMALRAHNQALSVFALRRGQETGNPLPNSAFAHPAVVANLARAVLQLADRPLTRDQESMVAALGDAWLVEEAEQPSTEGKPFVTRLAADIESKQRFVTRLKEILDPVQRGLLFRAESEARVETDILSPAVLLSGRRRHVCVHDPADLDAAVLARLLAEAGVEVEDPESYAWVAANWIDATPEAREVRPQLTMDMIWPPVDDAVRRLRHQGEAIERILGLGRLDPEAAERLRETGLLLIPQVVRRNEDPEER